jgi:glycosyltransferase involved in cell wall biosynthesis
MSCYNSSHVVAQIQSVLDQTEPPEQFVIVNDSTDPTIHPLIVAALSGRDASHTEIEVIRNEQNVGMWASYSLALDRVRTDLVATCDHDDVWFPEKLARVRAVFCDHDPIAVVHDATMFDGNAGPPANVGRLLSEECGWKGHGRYDGRAVPIPTLLRRNRFTGTALTVRADLVAHLLPLPTDIFPDYWIMLVSSVVGEMIWLDRPLVHYRRHEANTVALNANKTLRERGAVRPLALISGATIDRVRGIAATSARADASQHVERWARHLEDRAASCTGRPLRTLGNLVVRPRRLQLYPNPSAIAGDVLRGFRAQRRHQL